MTPKCAARIAAYEASYLAEYRSDVERLTHMLAIACERLHEAERQHAAGEPITSKFEREQNWARKP